MRKVQRGAGFTLIELMIVVAIIAIIAAIAIPGLLRARISSNEVSAIGTLKSLSTSMTQFQEAAIVDQDGDGRGEFGYFLELSGVLVPRGGAAVVNPTFMASNFGTTAQANVGPGAEAISDKSGYNFLIYLPNAGAGPATAEANPLPAVAAANANAQEGRWACYGWPTTFGSSGNRCFVINQEGQVYQASNGLATPYTGTTAIPAAGAAFDAANSVTPANLDGRITGGVAAVDTQTWTPAGG